MTMTLDDLRAYLGYQPAVTTDDAVLADALAAAQEAVEQFTGRTFGATTSSEVRIFAGGTFNAAIDDAQTVTLVEESSDRVTWSTIDASTYWLAPDNVTPKTRLCYLSGCLRNWVRVTGTWGYGATPASVDRATLMMASRLHKRRDSVEGVAGFGDFGVVRISNRTDPDVAALLNPYRRIDRTMGLA